MQLLERESYLNHLTALLAEAAAGEGRVVWVSGEAGIGKTSLVERFTRTQREVRVLWGACDLLFTPRPLGPWRDIAAQLPGELKTRLEAEADRAALFGAFLDELQREVTIVVIEDMHWADDATLDLLKYLGRRIRRTHTLLIATYRDDELSPQHPLRLVLGDLSAIGATRRLALPPLSIKAVQTLIGDRALEAAALHQQTGGNPFFVAEILASDFHGVPETIRDAVLARSARLSPSARAVLDAAAVIGARVEPWLLAEVTGAEAHAVDQCLHVGVLMAHDEWLVFRHELTRQMILSAIAPHQRIVLHRLVLDALKLSPVTRVDFARLAHHAKASGDHEAVLAYAPTAARRAAAASAHRESAALYDLALHFADDLPPVERAQLLEAYAQECILIDQRAIGLKALRQALPIWREFDNPVKQGGVLAHMANMLIGLGQEAEAERCTREAIALLEARPPSHELALAYRMQASVNMINNNVQEMISWAEKTAALAEGIQDVVEYLSAQNIMGSAWMMLDYERGCRHLEQDHLAAHHAGIRGTAAHAYANLGSISSELHQFRQAEQYLSEGLAYAAEYDLDRLWLYMQAWLAATQLYLGKWNEVGEAAAAVLGRSGVSTTSRITALVALGRVRTRRGDPEANKVLDEALELSKAMNSLDRICPIRTARAEAAWLAHDRASALKEACAVYDLAQSKRHAWYTGELAFWRWRCGDRFPLPDWLARPFALHIAGEWRAAAEEWKQLGCPYEQARALAEGDTAAQTAALAIFERLGAQPAIDDVRQKLRAAGVRNLPRATTRENIFGLTVRQLDILALLAEGLTNAEIAARLHLSPKTVDHHVSAVLAKLDVHSREEAVRVAEREGLVRK
ncbi:Transcriptional regulatory protein LiaR [Thermoflexales bacterium]|nr:Transcriptional regulatory protein LiaR [Thermoflexales bacterium]